MDKREYTYTGLATILLANIVWGISDISISYIGRGQLVTCLLGFTGFIFLVLINLIRKDRFHFRDFVYAFPIGLQRSIIWGGLFYAYQEDNPAIATTIYSFSLVVAIVIFGPLLGEKITLRVVCISLVGVAGVILNANESFTSLELSRGSIISLCMLPLGAAGTYLLRDLQKKVPAETAATYYFLWVGILMLPIAALTHPRFEFTHLEIWVIIAMTISGAGGHFLYSISQKGTTFQFNAIASAIHSPSTALCALIFLGATLAPHQIVGMIIVVAVVAYVSITANRKVEQELDESLLQET